MGQSTTNRPSALAAHAPGVLQRLSVAFAAGALGAVFIIAVAAALQVSGFFALIGLGALDAANLPFLYQNVTWGGIWGLLLATPFLAASPVLRGVIAGGLATTALFFIFFPLRTDGDAGPGVAGLNVGIALPVFAIAINSVWGIAAALFYERAFKS